MENLKNNFSDELTELENSVFEFIENLILGIELKVWDKFNESNNGSNKDEIDKKIKSAEALYVSNGMMEYYLNQTYKNLVEKSDDCINTTLNNFQEKMNMNNFTILNIISNVIMNSYSKLPRSKLNVEDKEKFKESVLSVNKLMKKFIVFDFRNKFKEVQEKLKNTKKEEDE